MNKVLVGLALFASACSASSVGTNEEAQLVSPDLVISEVYGGGGNTGAPYTNDFVSLFNRGTAAVSLTGYRLSYASATGAFGTMNVVSLSGSIAPGASYLVSLASGGSNGVALPTPDATGTINLAGTAGNIALINGATSTCGTTGGTCNDTDFVDLVAYGSTATHKETAPAPAPSNTVATFRHASGCVDTGNNASDFSTAAPVPRSSATAVVDCTAFDLSPVDIDAGTTPVVDMTAPAKDLSAAAGDMTSAPDFANLDFGTGPYLLNEVKWNPGGSDTGAEFVELFGAGELPPYTYLLSIDGDSAVAGRINFVHDLSLTAFGTNGLILVKGTDTTFVGTAAATTIVNDDALKASPLQNGTESVLLVQSSAPLVIKAGTTKIGDLAGYVVLDSIAAQALVGDPTFGNATIAPCPTGSSASAVDGASRIVGQLASQSATAWYAGQATGGPLDQDLVDVSACSGAASSTWTMSPGRPNDDPVVVPVDMATAPLVDMAGNPHDLATGAPDFAEPLDLSGIAPTDAAVKPTDMAHGVSARNSGGCSVGGQSPASSFVGLGLLAILFFARRRRTE